MSPEEIIESLGKFMSQTNEMIASMDLRIGNLQVDIDKLKKEIQNYKTNGRKHIQNILA